MTNSLNSFYSKVLSIHEELQPDFFFLNQFYFSILPQSHGKPVRAILTLSVFKKKAILFLSILYCSFNIIENSDTYY